MKKLIRWAACLGLCLALSVCAALAAEGDITVQLDGAPLTFTDAVPQVRDQRTYLPFRAVFEAMGAEVDYEGQVITAVRGGKTLTMTVGSAEAAVEEDGVTLPIQMDVAPYVDAATWRTYVPVRFAAQAFDCVVGWDQKTLTAIIIDAEKLTAAAKEGKSFTYLEKLAAMNEKYNSGLWDLTATFKDDISMMALPMITMNGDVRGTVQNADKLSMDMNMKIDMSNMISWMPMPGGGFTAEDQAAAETLKTDGIDLAIRGDLDRGKLYLNMDMGALGAKAGVEPDAWYELDMATLMKQDKDVLDGLTSLLTAAEPTDSTTAYADLKQSYDALFTAFSDAGFAEKDGAYAAEYTAPNGDTALALTLTMDGGQVSAYAMDVTANAAVNGGSVRMTMNVNMTADGKMNAGLDMDTGGMLTANVVIDGAFTPGATAPVTAPPAGAKVLPFDDLTKQGGGVISSGDGPTTLVGSPA